MKAWLQNSQTYGLSFLSEWGTQAEVITKGGRPLTSLQLGAKGTARPEQGCLSPWKGPWLQ